MKNQTWAFIAALGLASWTWAQTPADTTAVKTKDSVVKKATKELPLEPGRKVQFSTQEGTWISVDVHPSGTKIVFDLMGDIYEMPITGGEAKAITQGVPYDVHPKYSPDGKSIVYISDKSGSDNIWTLELKEGSEPKALTKDTDQLYASADWSPDGQYIVGTKGRRNMKPYIYHKDGGGGAQLIKEPASLKTIDPAFSPDGQSIYFSRRNANCWQVLCNILCDFKMGMK